MVIVGINSGLDATIDSMNDTGIYSMVYVGDVPNDMHRDRLNDIRGDRLMCRHMDKRA